MNFNNIENLISTVINSNNNIYNDTDINQCQKCPLYFCCKKQMCQANNFLCTGNCLCQSENQCWWDLVLYNNAAYIIKILQDDKNFQNYVNILLERG